MFSYTVGSPTRSLVTCVELDVELGHSVSTNHTITTCDLLWLFSMQDCTHYCTLKALGFHTGFFMYLSWKELLIGLCTDCTSKRLIYSWFKKSVETNIYWQTSVLCYINIGLAPSYLTNLMTPVVPSSVLRSQQAALLAILRTAKSSIRNRAFSYATYLWSKLPTTVTEAESQSLNHN